MGHYLRIFNSWVESYEYKPNSSGEVENPVLTGVPFNDAYRYMDWLLTVPLLLIEIVFVMKLSDEETKKKAINLGVASGLMICIGYPGELVVNGDLGVRWLYWGLAIMPFLYVVYELLVGMATATNAESDPTTKSLIQRAQYWTVVSWLTYPVVYVFPMIGFSGSHASSPSRWDIASLTLSPSVVSASSSTASQLQNPPVARREHSCLSNLWYQ